MPNTTPHKSTPESKEKVRILTAVGIPQESIARQIGVSKKTLIKHYRFELDTGTDSANGDVGGVLYNKAMSGDTTSMIFWLKTRARWKETTKVEHDYSADEVKARIKALLSDVE